MAIMHSTVCLDVGAGSHPTLSMNQEFTVVAGWSSTVSTNLSCRVGSYTVKGDGRSTIEWGTAVEYDDGDQASLAINDSGYVVSIHRSSTSSNNLFYRLGRVDQVAKTIQWGPSTQFNAGTDPFVAINEQVAVVVWSSSNSTNLYYSVGVLDEQNLMIKWSEGGKYDAGLHPTVSINNDNRVILGHASSESTNLYYQLGYVTSDLTQLKLGSIVKYDNGDSNDLTIDNFNVVWESHKSSNNNTAFYKVGTLDPMINTIDWATLEYDNDRTDTIRISTLQRVSSGNPIGVSIQQLDDKINVVIQEFSQFP